MPAHINYQILDTGLFLIANLINILLIGLFLVRPKKLERVEHILGLVIVGLAIPIALAVFLNLWGKREWWSIILPSLFILYAIVEFIFDYILKLNFRNTFLLWPYLLLFYLSQWGMIGFTFIISRTYGFITLVTYFLNLLATWYSYSKVGHG